MSIPARMVAWGRALTVIPLIAGSLAVVASAPAYAADTAPRYYDFHTEFGGWTKTANPGGRAIANGNVTFTNRRHVVIDVTQLQDQCNSGSDGIGAELGITFYVYNATTDTIGIDSRSLAHYYLACSSAWIQRMNVDYQAWDGFVVEYVKLDLQECTSATVCSTYARDYATSRKIDNPNVPAPHHL